MGRHGGGASIGSRCRKYLGPNWTPTIIYCHSQNYVKKISARFILDIYRLSEIHLVDTVLGDVFININIALEIDFLKKIYYHFWICRLHLFYQNKDLFRWLGSGKFISLDIYYFCQYDLLIRIIFVTFIAESIDTFNINKKIIKIK